MFPFLLEAFWILIGAAGLWLGSDIAVDSARKIASKLGVSELIIGLTIASIGTSLPEIFTNVMSGIKIYQGIDASGIALGNIIGSDLAQVTLLLGIAGFIATLKLSKKSLKRDGMMMFIALFLMYLVSSDGYVTQWEGIALVLIYLLYLIYLVNQEKIVSRVRERNKEGSNPSNLIVDMGKCLGGIIIVIYAANLVVTHGVILAHKLLITESLIGIFLCLGTSLPELSVAIRAISKKAGQLSLGNLIGSNITDPLLSFGLGASIAGVNVSPEVLGFDFIFWLFATAIALLLLFNHLDLNRKESSILILLYIMFLYFRIMFFP